jgi:hypothetical protein
MAAVRLLRFTSTGFTGTVGQHART